MEKEKKHKLLVVDATGCRLGRLASWVAKQARKGNQLWVINCKDAIIVGNPKQILDKYMQRLRRGRGSQKGPYLSRTVEGLVKRAIRGMIGWKKASGKEAFKRVKCFESIPEEIPTNAKKVDLPKEFKKEALKFISIAKLSSLLRGGKQ